MLVAYGPEGRPVIAEGIDLAQLKHWSQKNLLYCPNCRGIVHMRGGPEKRTQLHFAHQKRECAWSTESETLRHLRGKIVLAEWLRRQFPEAIVSLEKRLPEPNRIADIFVAHANGRQWAFEFQCAHLDLDEWKLRHAAYRNANIQDTWIIGSNRREKQETFIEAIIATAGEVMFLDPLLAVPIIWLLWEISRETMLEWQAETGWTPSIEGWVGRSRMKFGATLHGRLQDVSLGVDVHFVHANRAGLESRIGLLHTMKTAKAIDEATLDAYLHQIVGEEMLNVVLFPMLRAYLRDPDLLRRYNYGRDNGDQSVNDPDKLRMQQARIWLEELSHQGFPPYRLEKLAKEIPLIGPYAAFAKFVEMLAFLSKGAIDKQS